MADTKIQGAAGEVPAMPEPLTQILLHALEEGKKMLSEEGDIIPFTMMNIGGKAFFEYADGKSPEECYAIAKHTVEGARGAQSYALCYDGYVDTNEGTKDAVIAQGGVPGSPDGFAIGYIYDADGEGGFSFRSNPAYIGEAENYMAGLVELPKKEEAAEGEEVVEEEIEIVEDAEIPVSEAPGPEEPAQD